MKLGMDFVDFETNFVGLEIDFVGLEMGLVDLEMGFVDLDMDFLDLKTDFVGLGMDFVDGKHLGCSLDWCFGQYKLEDYYLLDLWTIGKHR